MDRLKICWSWTATASFNCQQMNKGSNYFLDLITRCSLVLYQDVRSAYCWSTGMTKTKSWDSSCACCPEVIQRWTCFCTSRRHQYKRNRLWDVFMWKIQYCHLKYYFASSLKSSNKLYIHIYVYIIKYKEAIQLKYNIKLTHYYMVSKSCSKWGESFHPEGRMITKIHKCADKDRN